MQKTTAMVMYVLLVLVAGLVSGDLPPTLVNTNQGQIQGLRATDGDYTMFLGLPFGRVREENPFGSAEPYPKFEHVFNAFDDSAICPQRENSPFNNTLDCLHLNIYVPHQATTNKIPVLVWIHGGGFIDGFAGRFMYGPKFLVQHDVILVTLNYRLGPYGFMCLGTPEVPGNEGLKDQRLALRWINDNIAAFGGDVSKITLMGLSAGGASVDLQLLAKQERLFNQIILQSGTAMASWAIGPPDTTAPIKIAEKLGHATKNLADALSFLSRTDTKLVIDTSSELGLSFRPCLEQEFENIESIVTEHPLVAEMPNLNNVKILAGFNNKEQLVTYALAPPSYFTNFDIFSIVRYQFVTDDDFKAMEDIVRRFYVGDEEPSEALRWNLMDFESDWYFGYPTQWSLNNYVETDVSDIYYYVFSYSGKRNFVKSMFNVTEEGAAHGDEISYLFDVSFKTETPSPEDQRMIDQMTTLWTNFVKYGDPTPVTSELLPVKWTPITRDTHVYLDLGSELEVKRRPFSDRFTFWQLFYKANWDRLNFITSSSNTPQCSYFLLLCFVFTIINKHI